MSENAMCFLLLVLLPAAALQVESFATTTTTFSTTAEKVKQCIGGNGNRKCGGLVLC